MKVPKELEAAQELAEADGWRIKQDGGHLKWLHPDGMAIVVISATPSDYRSCKNAISLLRKAGLSIPRRQSKKRRRTA